jgi:hypothetical protein
MRTPDEEPFGLADIALLREHFVPRITFLPHLIPMTRGILSSCYAPLVKTVKFRKPKYVGDPINAVKIFNDKEVDELIFLDIDATVEGRRPRSN